MVDGPLRKWLKDEEDKDKPVGRYKEEVEALRNYAEIKERMGKFINRPGDLSQEQTKTSIGMMRDYTRSLYNSNIIKSKLVYDGMQSNLSAMENVVERASESGIYDFHKMSKVAKDVSRFIMEKLEPEIIKGIKEGR